MDFKGNYYIHNGEAYSTKEELKIKENDNKVYEVIRVIDKVALFKEEHIVRMRKSAKLLGYEIIRNNGELLQDISKLIEVNDFENLNFKIECHDLDSNNQNIIMYFIKSSYPEKELYTKGIETILFNSVRENPNAKVVKEEFRNNINSKLKEENAFEALLVDGNGNITEGSRSNIFFVKNDTVYTANKGDVLLGITREKIIEACNNLGIEVLERDINVKDLSEYHGAIMTGTSVNALPIRKIDNIEYNSSNNPIIKKISKEFEVITREYINKN